MSGKRRKIEPGIMAGMPRGMQVALFKRGRLPAIDNFIRADDPGKNGQTDSRGSQDVLVDAVLNNDPLTAKNALDNGADPNAQNLDGQGPVHIACLKNFSGCLIELLKKGGRPNAKNAKRDVPLAIALMHQDKEAAEVLIKFKADVDAIRSNEDSLLIDCLRGENPGNAAFLIENNANPNMADSWGKTPLMHAVHYHCGEDIVRRLIDAGANIDARDAEDMTALMYAALVNDYDAVSFLLENGASPFAIDKKGNTVLKYASWSSDSRIKNLILKKIGFSATRSEGNCENSWLDEGAGLDGLPTPEMGQSHERDGAQIGRTQGICIGVTTEDGSAIPFAPIDKDEIIIGRETSVDLHLRGPEISRNHAKITRSGNSVFITDLNSSNGITIDGKKIIPEIAFKIRPGQSIKVGKNHLHVLSIDGIDFCHGEQKTTARFSPSSIFSDLNLIHTLILPTVPAISSDEKKVLTMGDENCDIFIPGIKGIAAKAYYNRFNVLVLEKTGDEEIFVNENNADYGVVLGNDDQIRIASEEIHIFVRKSRDAKEESFADEIYYRMCDFDNFTDEQKMDAHDRISKMEGAIKTLPVLVSAPAMLSWKELTRRGIENIGRISDKYEMFGQFELLFSSLDYLTGRACAHAQDKQGSIDEQLSFFRFINTNPRAIEFGVIAKTINGLGAENSREITLTPENRVMKAVISAWKQESYPAAQLPLIFDQIPNAWFNGEKKANLRKQLQSSNRRERATAIGELNNATNRKGIMLFERYGSLAVCKVDSIIQNGGLKSMLVSQKKGEVFRIKGFSRVLGFYDPELRSIVMDSSAKEKTSTSIHEMQHFLDDLCGHTMKLRSMRLSEDDLKMKIEETAIASEIANSGMNNHQAKKILRNFPGNHGRAAENLQKYLGQTEDASSCLARFIDDEYKKTIGISFSELFHGRRATPEEIIGKSHDISEGHTHYYAGK